jgi:hypothetical protein
MLQATNKALTSNDTFVTFDYTGVDGETVQYQLPSYNTVVNRLLAVEESINSLSTGKGSINLSDGTRRTITLSSVPTTPAQITGISDPSTFTIDSNWFFEDLMFPGAQVEIDLTDQIEDTADRVRVMRVILNSKDDDSVSIWDSDLSTNAYDYVSLITILNNNNISYYLDEETIELPLVSNEVSGTFQVTEDPTLTGNNTWYKLDTLSYSTISSNGVNQGNNNILSKGDMLSYSNTIYEIIEIDQNNSKVRLKRTNGVQTPGIYTTFTYYQDPFRSKKVKVRFGAHEYNILYFKGVAENYNLLADSWSTPVKFSSDDLVLSGSVGLQETPFANYYAQYIVDWGSKMIAEAKERKITAWFGSTPNTPKISADDFRVVQINTQINAAVDTTDVKNTAAEIESVKSQINSLKNTIAAQKTDLQSAANLFTYNSIQQQIATNTTNLKNLQSTYSTLVDSFQTIVKENSAITTDPKYHIRGFFPIPEYKYQDSQNLISEEIIGFDIAYRYIQEDSTSTKLNTFKYIAADGSEVTGTYTDWIIEQGPMKTKVYDTDLQRYIWKAENVADGTETNINQIDIAISKGEKVEMKVRSISEAGYPENPLRSPWSNSVIVDFPSTLATSNEIADLITAVNDDALVLTINNTLDSIGVNTHLDDTIPNSNSVSGMYFKHMASNIAVEEKSTVNSITTVNSISLQDKLTDLTQKISDNNSATDNSSVNIFNISTFVSEKSKSHDESISTITDEISKINSSINKNIENINSVRTQSGYVHNYKYIFDGESGNEMGSISSLNHGHEIFFLDGSTNIDDTLTSVHVKDLYVHPAGETLGEKISLSNFIQDASSELLSLKNGLEANTTAAITINSYLSEKVATVENLEDLKNNFESIQSEVRSIKPDDTDTVINTNNIFIKDASIVYTKLSSNNTLGNLYVYNGDSVEQLGDVNAEDFKIYIGGYRTGQQISMTDVYNTVKDNTDNIDTMTTTATANKAILDKITYTDSNNQLCLRGYKSYTTDAEVKDTLIIKNIQIADGTPFFAKNGTNQAAYVDGYFKDIVLSQIGTDKIYVYDSIKNMNSSLISQDHSLSYIKNSLVNDGVLNNLLNINNATVTNDVAAKSITMSPVSSENITRGAGTFSMKVSNNNGIGLFKNTNDSELTYSNIYVNDCYVGGGNKSLLDTYNSMTHIKDVSNDFSKIYSYNSDNNSTKIKANNIEVIEGGTFSKNSNDKGILCSSTLTVPNLYIPTTKNGDIRNATDIYDFISNAFTVSESISSSLSTITSNIKELKEAVNTLITKVNNLTQTNQALLNF